MPSKNHHGTPFIAVSTIVSGPSERRDARSHAAQRRFLDGDHDEVLLSERRRVVARR